MMKHIKLPSNGTYYSLWAHFEDRLLPSLFQQNQFYFSLKYTVYKNINRYQIYSIKILALGKMKRGLMAKNSVIR